MGTALLPRGLSNPMLHLAPPSPALRAGVCPGPALHWIPAPAGAAVGSNITDPAGEKVLSTNCWHLAAGDWEQVKLKTRLILLLLLLF